MNYRPEVGYISRLHDFSSGPKFLEPQVRTVQMEDVYFMRKRILQLMLLFSALILLAACGGGNSSTDSDSGASSEPTVAPTMPSASFAAVSQSAGVITETLVVSETESSGSTGDLDRGAAAYTKNKCGDCHGANGEGVTDKGNAIAGTTLSAEDFETVLRTGGGLGNEHIFGRSAISPGGMTALYEYVQSLK